MSWKYTRESCLLMMLVACATTCLFAQGSLSTIAVNDNRSPAGELRNGVLTIHLEIGEGNWRPEKDDGAPLRVYAFGEVGRGLQIPGPLIRVPQGSEIQTTVHNALPVAATVHGLHQRPGEDNAFTLQPGATQQVRFPAGAPGTYYYWASTTKSTIATWSPMETELAGALIIDPPGAVVNDRVLIMGRRTAPGVERALTINGKSWPYTERFTFNEDETVHWRVLNLSNAAHGMHLHGFYFHVDAVGDGNRVEPFKDTDPPLMVTQRVPIGGTFDMTWVAKVPGRWLFHCHMFAHMNAPQPPPGAAPVVTHDVVHGNVPGSAGMAGLVIGITILPKQQASQPPAWKAERKLQLVMEERSGGLPAFALEVRDPAKASPPPLPPAAPTTPQLLGPPIFLTQNQPTEIEVINRTKLPTAIHWHGMELDSYYDGVAGWGGNGQQTSPAVMPGESFVARLAPARAGSFIYHTHWHASEQINNGVYGPLVVMPPGQEFDPATDLNFLFSRGTIEPFGLMLLINGNPQPLVLNLKTGIKYRFRLTNITPNDVDLRVSLKKEGVPVRWRAIAKDGADLPPTAAIIMPADQFVTVGETWDFEYQANEAQELALEAYIPGAASKRRATLGLVFAPSVP